MAKKLQFKIPAARELLEAGVHFGHAPRRWHPAMAPFIYSKMKRIHILDLEKTEERLAAAGEFLCNTARSGGTILFVGLRRQSEELIREEAKRCGAMHVTGRWLGGLLTNFSEVSKNITKLKKLEAGISEGEFDYYTKKEQLEIKREIARLEKLVGGIRELSGLPDAIFLASAKRARTAVREASSLDIPIVAIVDSNTDPRPIDYPIPGNDDALKSLRLLVRTVADAVEAGYKEAGKKVAKVKEPAEAEEAEEKGRLEDLGLSARAENALKKAGIESVERLKELSKEELSKIKGIGERTVEEITKAIR